MDAPLRQLSSASNVFVLAVVYLLIKLALKMNTNVNYVCSAFNIALAVIYCITFCKLSMTIGCIHTVGVKKKFPFYAYTRTKITA